MIVACIQHSIYIAQAIIQQNFNFPSAHSCSVGSHGFPMFLLLVCYGSVYFLTSWSGGLLYLERQR